MTQTPQHPILTKLTEYMQSFSDAMKSMNFRNLSGNELCIKYGKPVYDNTPISPDIQKILEGVSRKMTFYPQACFQNSQEFVRQARRLKINNVLYCEGFTITESLPLAIHHAWVMINNQIIDGTFEAYNISDLTTRVNHNRKTTAYYGISFDSEYIVTLLKENRAFLANAILDVNYSKVTKKDLPEFTKFCEDKKLNQDFAKRVPLSFGFTNGVIQEKVSQPSLV